MNKIAETTHNNEKIEILETEYTDGSLAVVAYTKEGEPYSDVSTNLSTNEETHIYVKDNGAQNEIAQDLVDQGVLEKTGEVGRSGFNTYLKYKVNL